MFVNLKQIFINDDGDAVLYPVLVQAETVSCIYQSAENPNTSVIVFNNGNTVMVNETFFEVQERLEKKKGVMSSNGWVPCSEYLPDEDDYYIVSVDEGNLGDYLVDMDEYKNGQWKSYGKKVAAWMKLPEAYGR